MKENSQKKFFCFLKTYGLFFLTLAITLVIWLTNTNHELFFTINAEHSWLPDFVWKAIIFISWEKTFFLPVVLIIITWFFRRNKILNVLFLIVAYYVLYYVLKISIHEARPYIQHDPSFFFWLSQPNVLTRAYRSFPSGHTGNMTIFVFTLSYFFAQDKLWLRTLLIIVLLFTMLAQICTGWHFPIDVLMSALIGFVLTQLCLNLPIRYPLTAKPH